MVTGLTLPESGTVREGTERLWYLLMPPEMHLSTLEHWALQREPLTNVLELEGHRRHQTDLLQRSGSCKEPPGLCCRSRSWAVSPGCGGAGWLEGREEGKVGRCRCHAVRRREAGNGSSAGSTVPAGPGSGSAVPGRSPGSGRAPLPAGWQRRVCEELRRRKRQEAARALSIETRGRD